MSSRLLFPKHANHIRDFERKRKKQHEAKHAIAGTPDQARDYQQMMHMLRQPSIDTYRPAPPPPGMMSSMPWIPGLPPHAWGALTPVHVPPSFAFHQPQGPLNTPPPTATAPPPPPSKPPKSQKPRSCKVCGQPQKGTGHKRVFPHNKWWCPNLNGGVGGFVFEHYASKVEGSGVDMCE